MTILVMTPKIKIFTVMKGLTIDEGQRCSRKCRTYSIIAGTPVEPPVTDVQSSVWSAIRLAEIHLRSEQSNRFVCDIDS